MNTKLIVALAFGLAVCGLAAYRAGVWQQKSALPIAVPVPAERNEIPVKKIISIKPAVVAEQVTEEKAPEVAAVLTVKKADEAVAAAPIAAPKIAPTVKVSPMGKAAQKPMKAAPTAKAAPQEQQPADAQDMKAWGRSALSFVGVDPEAEHIWVQAINDNTLDKETRKDLIEDLNEDGFPDPKHVTIDDLPLIVNRLGLIEELAPDAMDDANAEAFQEAYKDLINMLGKLARQ